MTCLAPKINMIHSCIQISHISLFAYSAYSAYCFGRKKKIGDFIEFSELVLF